MNTLYHLQVGSLIANAGNYNLRERRLIMIASLAPDLDGALMVFGQAGWKYHHTFSHNVFYCLLVSLVLALVNRARRAELFAVCAACALLQILIDVFTNDPTWSQQFLRPLTDYNFVPAYITGWEYLGRLQVVWIQGFLMIAIFTGTIVLYLRAGRTFLELISTRLDVFITDFIRLPFTARCVVCGRRAYYREEGGGPLCPNHVRIRRNLKVEKKGGPDPPEKNHD